jgi:hypothetical protein
VLKSGRFGSVIEVTRFELPLFTMSMKELAEWFGFELARLVVDECLDGSLYGPLIQTMARDKEKEKKEDTGNKESS